MPWKKAWPAEVKNKLKALGISDKNIRTLEGYGSFEELRRDPKKALENARAAEVESALRDAGF